MKLFRVRKKRKKATVNKQFVTDKESAHKFVVSRLELYNKHYNFTYNKVRIKNSKSRWGSCSSKKNLNFNYKILYLPEQLADYVVVHELCHLKELNHSNKYWALVEQTMPNYKILRKALREISKTISFS